MKADKDVLKIALAFKHEMSKRKLKYQWPQAKDITKTYHYRWFKRFLTNCRDEHDMDMDETLLVLKSIMHFANERGLLRRGATLLQRGDQIDIFIKSANDEIEKEQQVLEELENCEEFLQNKDKERFLSKKERRGGHINLIKLSMDGKIPIQYITLSKTCMKVYNSLEAEDKKLLPPIIEMSKLRNRTIRVLGRQKVKEILKEDFNG